MTYIRKAVEVQADETPLELFVITDREGKIVERGFNTKPEAKKVRDQLQHNARKTLPVSRSDHRQWDYKISPGKDHHRMSPALGL